MVDPLSVIALGITVLQGLVAASSSWRGFGGDLQAAAKQIEDLHRTLSALSSLLESSPLSGADKELVEEKIVGCQDGIATLQAALVKLQGCEKEGGEVSESRRRLQHVLFVFKRSGFKELGGVVTDLQHRLGLALQVYQVAGIVQVGIQAKTNAENNGKALADLQDSVDRMSDPADERSIVVGISRVEHGLKNGAETTRQSIAELKDAVDELIMPTTTMLARIELNTSSRPHHAEEALIQRLDAMERRIIARLGSVQDVEGLRETRSLENELNRGIAALISKPDSHKSVLDIKARMTEQCILCQSGQELQICFRCQRLPRRTRYRAKQSRPIYAYHLYIPWAQRSISLAMDINFGAGGQGVGFGLALRGRVCNDSPAFQLIRASHADVGRRYHDRRFETDLCDLSERLRHMIVERVISVGDVDSEGNTLMHKLLGHLILPSKLFEVHERELEAVLKVIEMMVELGVPVNETDRWHRSPLSGYAYFLDLRRPAHKRFWQSISQMGFEAVGNTGDFNSPSWIPRRLALLVHDDSIAEEGYSCGELSMAVLRRSEEDVLRVLKRSPSSLCERNSEGETPLHLAVGWPQGLRLLLDAGADYNASDHYGSTILSYACAMECHETVALLLERQACFLDRNGLPFLTSIISHLPYVSDERVVDLILDALVTRRIRLSDMGRDFLPKETMDGLIPRGCGVLDIDVDDLLGLLTSANVSIPPFLDTRLPDRETVFHLAAKSVTLASKLWNLGFRDVDGFDGLGRTPLTELFDRYARNYDEFVRMLEIAFWFVERGASIFTERRGTGRLAAHHFAKFIGRNIRWLFIEMRYGVEEWENDSDSFDKVLDQFQTAADLGAASLVHDTCSCRCSQSGCTSHTSFIQSLFNTTPQDRFGHSVAFEYTGWWINKFNTAQSDSSRVMKHILRASIFEILDLRHTCYAGPRYAWIKTRVKQMEDIEWMQEIREIDSEQAESYDLLEALLKLALSQWERETRPFSEFMGEFYKREILAREGPPTEDYVKQLEEIGVCVYKAKEEEEIDEDEDDR